MKVLITGGANGIGKATAELLQERGHEVIVFDRDEEALQELDCETVHGDVADEEKVVETIEKYDFDSLVNCAGYYEQGAIEDTSDETAREMFDDNFFGALNFCRSASEQVRENDGKIINVASVAGRVTFPFYGIYCASKHALEAATHAFRMETDFDVVLIEPGVIDTGFNKRARQAVEKYIPESRYTEVYREKLEGRSIEGSEPEKVAEMIVKALEAENPKPRYAVRPEAKLAPQIQKIVPLKLWDRLLNKFVD